MLGLLGALAAPVAAQNVLFVENDGKPCLVRAARDTYPCIEVNGKLERVPGHRFALKPVEEFIPFFVAVRHLEVKSTYLMVNGTGEMNNELNFRAEFETGYRLDDVFLLLDMQTDRAGRAFFLYEVGRLVPHEAKLVRLTAPLAYPIGSGQFQFHLFVGGAEALHSEIPAINREAVLDRMIAKRVANLPDGGPRPFVGPVPEYPAALRKANVPGQAVISFWLRTTGSVRDPVIKSATDPALGEAALVAARLWRFLPQVKDGHPVETQVEMPFNFGPPPKPAEKT
jgi:TonB family protein